MMNGGHPILILNERILQCIMQKLAYILPMGKYLPLPMDQHGTHQQVCQQSLSYLLMLPNEWAACQSAIHKSYTS